MRNYVARAGIARAFNEVGDEFRLGWGRINTNNETSTNAVVNEVRPFDQVRKQEFFEWLYDNNQTWPSGGTPLRKALDDAGQYYTTAQPWADNPATGSGTNSAKCRKSFTILMTDGYWNSGEAVTSDARKNVDDFGGATTFITPQDKDGMTQSISTLPYKDGYAGTLADVAMYYWKQDLRPDSNEVVPTTRDPAFWQHMTTYTIGLGVAPENIAVSSAWDALDSGTAINWPQATEDQNQIDDLLHAAVNGHGDFASAKKPEDFAAAMKEFLDQIKGTIPIAPPTSTSGSLRSSTFLYEASYKTDWTGTLDGYPLCSLSEVGSVTGCTNEGDIVKPATWHATIPSAASRKIYLCNRPDTTAECSSLLTGSSVPDVPNWSTAMGATEWGKLRSAKLKFNKEGLLGDIINSSPLYVENEDYGYGSWSSLSSAERSAYVATRDTRTRPAVIYTGSNDGMLHAFKAAVSHDAPGSGEELFAYIPRGIFTDLPERFQNNYVHRFFVDGPPITGDANLGTATSPAWSTVLVGSTGAGGKSYFALNVENPAAPQVLWEVGPEVGDFKNLGATLGQATIARLQDGQWVAVFANGYNAADNEAHLYIVDLKTGARLKDITLRNSAEDGAADVTPNGLSTPLVADRDRDGSADTIYAGDMLGNLWKIDVSAAALNSMQAESSLSTPLFKTRRNGKTQPIYARPSAILRPNSAGDDVLVFFGTGKFFEKKRADGTGHDDLTDDSVQSFYGIKDNGTRVALDDLVEQEITQATADVGDYSKKNLRLLTKNKVDYNVKFGFYIDLVDPGERVIFPATMLPGLVLFTTLTPVLPTAEQSCETGSAYTWTMVVDLDGGRTDYSIFDLDRNGVINSNDESGGNIVNGIKDGESGSGGHTVVASNESGINQVCTGSLAKCHPLIIPSGQGRESWQQLKGR
jgi:type IV pilus assembly protein PilY1